jgi:hypothetical protein
MGVISAHDPLYDQLFKILGFGQIYFPLCGVHATCGPWSIQFRTQLGVPGRRFRKSWTCVLPKSASFKHLSTILHALKRILGSTSVSNRFLALLQGLGTALRGQF